ncbi:MAG: hypothetical protein LBT57_03280 [Puniceicoccales bacterium]|jgi:hypothetical protein|nr:hypothetical protein [Puniceicoccales bacterium]
MAGGKVPKVLIDAGGGMPTGAAWLHVSAVPLAGVNPDADASPEVNPIAYTYGLDHCFRKVGCCYGYLG